ncbi:MAG: PfkB family carbohydrate kinase [Bacteroidales bacterium]
MNKKAVFIGRSTIDHTYLLDSYPQENTKVFARKYLRQFGGPALNAAITFDILGARAKLISYFGNNSSMEKVKAELKSKYGIDIVDLIKDNSYRLPESSIFVSNSGTRTIVNAPWQDYKKDICCENLDLAEASVILLDGFVFSGDLKIQLLEARRRGAVIVLDGGSWKDETMNILDTVDIAICSSKFMMPGYDIDQTITCMLNKGVDLIAITNNEKDINVYESNSRAKIPVKRVNAIDTLGAGDVLHGAFCYYLTEGFNPMEALRRAAQIASRSCCYFGTHTWKDYR